MPKIFVVIVTYNGAKWINKCLDSVYNSTIKATPIVLDNGSTDETISIIREQYPQCQLIETGQNLGFGKANNLGIQEAINKGAEYIYLLNQDAWVDTDCFEKLISMQQKNQEYGIISPLQVTGSGDKLDYNFYKDTLLKVDELQKHDINSLNFQKECYEVPFVAAAHWLLKVEDILKYGHFSTIFPHYGEDNNLIQRYQYWEKKAGVCTTAYAYHDREYRVESAAKLLYKKYCYLLCGWNNPLISSGFGRFSIFCHFVARCLKVNGVSLAEKINTIVRGINTWKESCRYRKIYKSGNCYKEFTVVLHSNKLNNNQILNNND